MVHMEHSGLGFGGFAKQIEIIGGAGLGLVLLALAAALGFVALFLLTGLFLLTFGEC